MITAAVAVGVLVVGGGVAGSTGASGYVGPEREGDTSAQFGDSPPVPVLAALDTSLAERGDTALGPLVVLGLMAPGGGFGQIGGPAAATVFSGGATGHVCWVKLLCAHPDPVGGGIGWRVR